MSKDKGNIEGQETKIAKGKCLCGAVEVLAKSMSSNVGACHCNMCRKWSAGAFMSVDCGTDVDFSGEENITRFQSSDWAERGFCALCGTNLFYYLKDASQYIFSAEIFENEKAFNFDHQIFIDEKPSYYSFSNDTKNMTGAEVFAAYGPDN